MDSIMLMMVAGFSGVFAMFWGVAALVVWLGYRRRPVFSGFMLAASLGALVLSLAAMPPGYSESERDRVERLHAQFAPALERYRAQHGEYPSTLEAAGITPPQTRYGPLEYSARRHKDGAPQYSIGFGDYNRNGFSAWWSSNSRDWYIDS